MSRLNPLVFPISPSLKGQYTSPVDSSLFNVSLLGLTGDFLVIWTFPEDYKPTSREKEIVRGIEVTHVFPSSEPYSFEAQIKDSREAAIAILEILAIETVTVYDYFKSDGSNLYTLRQGILTVDRTGSFYSQKLGQNLHTGFRLLFEEV